MECRILSEARDDGNGEPFFQPALDLDRLTVSYVIRTLEEFGTDDIPVAQSEELSKISECLNEFSTAIENSEANLLLKNI